MRPSLLALTSIALLASACPGSPGRPRGNPRPPGTNNCGNGQLNAGEQCDTAIAQGMPGACPTACNDGNSCTADMLTGSGCAAACTTMAIANCANDDGCCPTDCTNANDNNCSATCGDGIIDPNEACDGNCPVSCNDGIGCTADTLIGSATNCSASCTYASVMQCTAGDGCCPGGCTSAMDSDCSDSCGDGIVDSGESCDMNCPGSCDDGNACTTDIVLGSASTCSFGCGRQTVRQCTDGDGCCPSGCAGMDADCSTTCGNGTVDSGETCDGDCPSECPATTDCDMLTYVGSPATCNVACIPTTITTCTDGDGCCPALCSNATDADCTGGPTGAIGDACVDTTGCTALVSPFSAFCVTTFPEGYCSAFCVENACPTGSRCALDFSGLCIQECATPADCRTPGYDCRELFDPSEQIFLGCAPTGA